MLTTLLLAIQLINPPTVHKPTGYTHAAKPVGCQVVFLSGQVALDVEGKLVGSGFAAQAQQVFHNIEEVVKASGGTMKDIVKLNFFVVGLDADRLTALRAARNKAIPQENLPASTLVGVTSLARPEFLLEVEAVACVK